MKNESVTCPTCGGQGHMYQIEASLGGDLLREPPASTYSEKVTCPRCGGKTKHTAMRELAIKILQEKGVLLQDFDPGKPFQLNISRDGQRETVECVIQAVITALESSQSRKS